MNETFPTSRGFLICNGGEEEEALMIFQHGRSAKYENMTHICFCQLLLHLLMVDIDGYSRPLMLKRGSSQDLRERRILKVLLSKVCQRHIWGRMSIWRAILIVVWQTKIGQATPIKSAFVVSSAMEIVFAAQYLYLLTFSAYRGSHSRVVQILTL